MEFALYSYTQIWDDKIRIILVSDKGSVFLDITYSPNGKDKKALIWGLNVKEEYRGKHFAGVLLGSAEAAAKEYDSGYSRLCKDLIKDLDGTDKTRQEKQRQG